MTLFKLYIGHFCLWTIFMAFGNTGHLTEKGRAFGVLLASAFMGLMTFGHWGFFVD